MKNKTLVLLVGNIASGKSTICKKYQETGYIVISKDMIRYAIGGGKYIFNKRYEPIVFDVELEMLVRFLELGAPIVIDSVNLSKRLRLEYITWAKDEGYKTICHIMPKISMKEAVDRRMKDKHGNFRRKTWEKVWIRFNSIYEKPSLKEGIDKIIKEKK